MFHPLSWVLACTLSFCFKKKKNRSHWAGTPPVSPCLHAKSTYNIILSFLLCFWFKGRDFFCSVPVPSLPPFSDTYLYYLTFAVPTFQYAFLLWLFFFFPEVLQNYRRLSQLRKKNFLYSCFINFVLFSLCSLPYVLN